jgi:hypothetical protein
MELIDPELKKCLAKDDTVGIRTYACDNYDNKDNNLYNRFLRKKRKCVILWFISIIFVAQLLYIIFEKIDTLTMGKILSKLLGKVNKNSTL